MRVFVLLVEGSCQVARRFSVPTLRFGDLTVDNPSDGGPDDTAIFLARLNVDGRP